MRVLTQQLHHLYGKFLLLSFLGLVLFQLG